MPVLSSSHTSRRSDSFVSVSIGRRYNLLDSSVAVPMVKVAAQRVVAAAVPQSWIPALAPTKRCLSRRDTPFAFVIRFDRLLQS